MKSKSVGAFVCGLIGLILLSALTGIIMLALNLILTVLTLGQVDTSGITALLTIWPLLAILLTLIGLFFCFTYAKVSGILITIAAGFSLVVPIMLLVNFSSSAVFGAIIFAIPSILLLISGILGLKAKKRVALPTINPSSTN